MNPNNGGFPYLTEIIHKQRWWQIWTYVKATGLGTWVGNEQFLQRDGLHLLISPLRICAKSALWRRSRFVSFAFPSFLWQTALMCSLWPCHDDSQRDHFWSWTTAQVKLTSQSVSLCDSQSFYYKAQMRKRATCTWQQSRASPSSSRVKSKRVFMLS